MQTHDASDQSLGYYYQSLYALYLLISGKKGNFKLEKFDDISFEENDDSISLIQVKHHINNRPNLTIKCNDFWRTLSAWIDFSESNDFKNTAFIIVTTADKCDAFSAFDEKKSNEIQLLFQKLLAVAKENANAENSIYYKKFIDCPENKILAILSRITIIPNSPNIRKFEEVLKEKLDLFSPFGHEEDFLDEVYGMWFKICIDHLSGKSTELIDYNVIKENIQYIRNRYNDDNLPENYDNNLVNKYINNSEYDEIFIRQLQLISDNSERFNRALIDYYKTIVQRDKWLKDGYVCPNELSEYESRLVDEWERAKIDFFEDSNTKSKTEKKNIGLNLYKNLTNKDIRIREKFSNSFFMVGTFHFLANDLKIGWHPDYLELLKDLLK